MGTDAVACRHERLHRLHEQHKLAKWMRVGMQRHARCRLRYCSGPGGQLGQQRSGMIYRLHKNVSPRSLFSVSFVSVLC